MVMGNLPDSRIQEMLFGVIFSLGINFACFGAFFVKSKDIVLSAIAGLLIIMAIGVRQYIIRYDKNYNKNTNTNVEVTSDNNNNNNNNKVVAVVAAFNESDMTKEENNNSNVKNHQVLFTLSPNR